MQNLSGKRLVPDKFLSYWLFSYFDSTYTLRTRYNMGTCVGPFEDDLTSQSFGLGYPSYPTLRYPSLPNHLTNRST